MEIVVSAASPLAATRTVASAVAARAVAGKVIASPSGKTMPGVVELTVALRAGASALPTLRKATRRVPVSPSSRMPSAAHTAVSSSSRRAPVCCTAGPNAKLSTTGVFVFSPRGGAMALTPAPRLANAAPHTW